MFTTRTSPSTLEQRLDPQFYWPEHINDVTNLERFARQTLDSLRDKATPITYGVLKPRFRDSQFRLARIQNFNDPFLDVESCHGIEEIQFLDYKRSEAAAGDILIAIGGYVGRAAIVPRLSFRLNINQHIARFRPSKLIDPYFAVTYLICSVGTRQTQRYVSGSVQTGINLEDLRELQIPIPHYSSQRYIGDKVRQAESLRTYAYETVTKLDVLFDRYIPRQDWLPFGRRTQRVTQSRLDDRLDAEHFPAAVQQYLRSLKGSFSTLEELGAQVFNGQTQPDAHGGEASSQITVANLAHYFVRGEPRRVTPGGTARKLSAHDLLLCNAAHSKSYIGKDVAYFDGEESVIPSTEVSVVRVNRAKLPASYVRRYLLTQVGYLQIQSTVRGITAHSYPKDLCNIAIPIPEIAAADKELWSRADDLMLNAARANRLADLLSRSAVYFLEALIYGRILEATLIATQQSIEKGDRRQDRDLLSRLTPEGFDHSDHRQLFPNVDSVYEIVDAAQLSAVEAR
ncbi:MAG: restriction endonuclease subunit S [Acidobacteria bacterium]|nr:restriction endonuclease subunit S [Acidobacteriota bacterium]